jgi:hypothetical protein
VGVEVTVLGGVLLDVPVAVEVCVKLELKDSEEVAVAVGVGDPVILHV